MTKKQTPRNDRHLQVLGKLIRTGKVKKDDFPVKDPVNGDSHIFRNATTLTVTTLDDGFHVIYDEHGKPLPPEVEVDLENDEIFKPIIVAAVLARFESLRNDGKRDYKLSNMVTHVKTVVNLKGRYITESYLGPLWEGLKQEDQGVCNYC